MQYDTAMPSLPPQNDRVSSQPVSARSIALPVEHGGWGFTLEPVLLGLLVAVSAAAWELSVAAIGIFLSRRPAKLVLTDAVRRRWLPRSKVALAFAGIYGAIALAGLVGALVTAEPRFLLAYAVAVPFAVVALRADARSKSRTLIAELAGSIAMGSTVTAIALADNWAMVDAFGLWLILVVRGVTTISLVRGQIRRVHEKPVGESRIYVVQVAGIVAMVAAAVLGAVPWLGVLAIAGIGVLAYVSLKRPPVPARVVGWTQIVTGLGVVVLSAIGVWLGC
jgi:hypothetical protein